MRGVVVGLTIVLALAGTSSAAIAAPINDDFADALTLQLGNADTRSNTDATIESDEPLTANDPAGRGCTPEGTAAAGGTPLKQTLWWEFTGNGQPITVSTLGSNFDTVLAVYETDARAFVVCNEDIQPYDPTQPLLEYRLTSEVVVDSVDGRRYFAQVGGCAPPADCNPTSSGDVTVRVSPPPANDARAAAKPIAAGSPVAASNTGATTESEEVLTCRRHDDRTAPYAKTVWFRWTAPGPGTASFAASGFDTVIAVYRGDSPTAIGCNDDAVENNFGPSRLPMSQPPGPPVTVVEGDYLIQVGGYHDPGTASRAARNGPLNVQVEFTPDPDIDDDGVNADTDCNDRAPDIRPGAAEIVNNDIDENCDGIAAEDRDRDGFQAFPAGNDCHDSDPTIYPGAPEVAGDRIDQDCNAVDPPDLDPDRDGSLSRPAGDDCWPNDPTRKPGVFDRPRNGIDEDCSGQDAPLPLLDLAWRVSSRNLGLLTRVSRVNIGGAPANSTFVLRCRGKGCRPGPRRRFVRGRPAFVSLFGLLRRAVRRSSKTAVLLRAGTRIDIRVTSSGYRGLGRVYEMQRDRELIFREFCLAPRARTPCR